MRPALSLRSDRFSTASIASRKVTFGFMDLWLRLDMRQEKFTNAAGGDGFWCRPRSQERSWRARQPAAFVVGQVPALRGRSHVALKGGQELCTHRPQSPPLWPRSKAVASADLELRHFQLCRSRLCALSTLPVP